MKKENESNVKKKKSKFKDEDVCREDRQEIQKRRRKLGKKSQWKKNSKDKW